MKRRLICPVSVLSWVHTMHGTFVKHHVWMCQKDLSNLTHTFCFDVSIYHQIGEPDVTNEQMTHLLKLDTFFQTHNAWIMTHGASQIRTTHRVDPALETLEKEGNMFGSDTLAWQISCRACSRFFSQVQWV